MGNNSHYCVKIIITITRLVLETKSNTMVCTHFLEYTSAKNNDTNYQSTITKWRNALLCSHANIILLKLKKIDNLKDMLQRYVCVEKHHWVFLQLDF